MTDVNLVTEKRKLDELLGRLSRVSRVACDTEAASFHRYRDRVFLIQLSSDDETAIVDPLAFDGLDGIGKILEEPRLFSTMQILTCGVCTGITLGKSPMFSTRELRPNSWGNLR